MIRIKTNGLFDGYFTRLFKPIYVATSSKEKCTIDVQDSLCEYIDLVNNKIDIFDCNIVNDDDKIFNLSNNKKVMVAFSGGKDCVAVACKFLSKGYDVVLYHLSGINRSYPQEKEYAKKVADMLGVEIIFEKVSISGKCDYIENPTRNQFILAMMVDCGVKMGIYRYAFGNQISDTISNVKSNIMCSDSYELFVAIDKFYKTKIPNFKLMTVLKHLTDSYCTVASYNSELFTVISSCNGQLRFKSSRRTEKENKFGVKLLDGRCGTCYKCANEIILLQMLGVINYPQEYIDYCQGVLDKWTSQLYNTNEKDIVIPNWYDEKYVNKFLKQNKNKIKSLNLQ